MTGEQEGADRPPAPAGGATALLSVASAAGDGNWRLRHLPFLLAGCGAVAVVAVAATAGVAGSTAALGMAAGTAAAVLSFTVTTVTIAWLDRVAQPLILPFGLALYVTKLSLFGVVMWAVAETGWAGLPAVALGIAVGAFAWIGLHIGWLQTRRGRPQLWR